MMPPLLHLSDVRCERFPYRRYLDKEIKLLMGAVNKQMTEGVYRLMPFFGE